MEMEMEMDLKKRRERSVNRSHIREPNLNF
jgi:hypothetical protein